MTNDYQKCMETKELIKIKKQAIKKPRIARLFFNLIRCKVYCDFYPRN